jgi:nucleotide-binding universal stress UspA family protein
VAVIQKNDFAFEEQANASIALARYAAMAGRVLSGRCRSTAAKAKSPNAVAFDLRQPRRLLGREILFVPTGNNRRQCASLALRAPTSLWLVPPDAAPSIRRVLVPFTGSAVSLEALRLALELVRGSHLGAVIPLHVRYPVFGSFANGTAAAPPSALMKSLARDNPHVRLVFAEAASVPRAIAAAADRHSVDLIVLTSRRRSRAASLLLDSITAQTILTTSLPILVIRSPNAPVGLLGTFRDRIAAPARTQFS